LAIQDFESTLKDSVDEVATFEDEQNGFLNWIKTTLHRYPSVVPLMVLLASIAGFGFAIGAKFFSPFALTLVLQQVAIVGIIGAAQSLVSALLCCDGTVHFPLWSSCRGVNIVRFRGWRAMRIH